MQKSKANPVKTVLIISVGFTVIYLVTKSAWAISISLIVGLSGIASDYISQKIDFLWMKLSSLLSKIVPNILLSAIFYFFLFPLAILSKLFGKKDPMRLKNTRDTIFVAVEKNFEKTSFEKPW